jgi:hypothetical protein
MVSQADKHPVAFNSFSLYIAERTVTIPDFAISAMRFLSMEHAQHLTHQSGFDVDSSIFGPGQCRQRVSHI